MLRTYVIVGLSLFTLAGCHHRSHTAQARYYDDGRIKPTIALVPVIDSTEKVCIWDLSKELTQSIAIRLETSDRLFLADSGKAKRIRETLNSTHNPFGKDLSWVKSTSSGQDFAVFMELLEHTEKPLLTYSGENPENCPTELNISLRVKVVDLRATTPKIVLQEIVHEQHHIPRQFTKYHFYQYPWKSTGENSAFAISPVGLAHAQLIKKIASRIEDYILTQL